MSVPIAGTLVATFKIKNFAGNSLFQFSPQDAVQSDTNQVAYIACSGGANLTTIATGPYTLPLSNATVSVASAAQMPPNGTIQVNNGAVVTVTYTGNSGNNLTGCNSGGTGTLATGNNVSMPGTIFQCVLSGGANPTVPWYQDQSGTVTGYFAIFDDAANSQLVVQDQANQWWAIPYTAGSPPVQSGTVSVLQSAAISNIAVSNHASTATYDSTTGLVSQGSTTNNQIYQFTYAAPATTTFGGQFVAVTHPFYWGTDSNFMTTAGLAIAEGTGAGSNAQRVVIASAKLQVIDEWTNDPATGAYTDTIIADGFGMANSTALGSTPGVAIPVILADGCALCYDNSSPIPLIYAAGIVSSTWHLYLISADRKTVTSLTTWPIGAAPVLKMHYYSNGGFGGAGQQVGILDSDQYQLFE